MKTSMLCIGVFLTMNLSYAYDQSKNIAMANGAKVSTIVKVVDDKGASIPEAEITVGLNNGCSASAVKVAVRESERKFANLNASCQ